MGGGSSGSKGSESGVGVLVVVGLEAVAVEVGRW